MITPIPKAPGMNEKIPPNKHRNNFGDCESPAPRIMAAVPIIENAINKTPPLMLG
jgi:hypothetical protein